MQKLKEMEDQWWKQLPSSKTAQPLPATFSAAALLQEQNISSLQDAKMDQLRRFSKENDLNIRGTQKKEFVDKIAKALKNKVKIKNSLKC